MKRPAASKSRVIIPLPGNISVLARGTRGVFFFRSDRCKGIGKTKSTKRGRHVRFVFVFHRLDGTACRFRLVYVFKIYVRKAVLETRTKRKKREGESGAKDTFCFGIVTFVKDKRGEW